MGVLASGSRLHVSIVATLAEPVNMEFRFRGDIDANDRTISPYENSAPKDNLPAAGLTPFAVLSGGATFPLNPS
jgi:hypothetical protein